MRFVSIALSVCFCSSAVGACDSSPTTSINDTDQPKDVVELARVALTEAQPASILENVEYCGYIVSDRAETLKIIGPQRGSRTNCETPIVYEPDVILASFHTHGGIDDRVRTEIPSVLDFDAVKAEGLDAFIGTPGGRFWHLDVETATARTLCGPKNCLPFQEVIITEGKLRVPDTLTRQQVSDIERSDH